MNILAFIFRFVCPHLIPCQYCLQNRNKFPSFHNFFEKFPLNGMIFIFGNLRVRGGYSSIYLTIFLQHGCFLSINITKYNLEFLHRTCKFFVIFRPFQKNCKYFQILYKSSLVALFCQIEACNNTTQSFLSRRVQHQIGVAVVLNSERVQHQLDVAVVLVWRECITKLELQPFWIQR